MDKYFYKELINKANIGYALFKTESNNNNVFDFYIEEINEIFEAHIGKRNEELIKKDSSEVFAEDKECLIALLKLFNSPIHKSKIFSKALNRWCSVEAIKLEDNMFIVYLSDSRNFHNFQEEHEEMFRIASIGKWELDIKTGKIEWSKGIYELFDLKEEVFEPSYDAFLNAIHPDDRETVNNTYTLSIQNKEDYEVDHRILMKNGKIKWVTETCKHEYDKNRNPIKSVGIVQDITKRKRNEKLLIDSEHRLKKAQEIAHVGDWELNLETKTMWASQESFNIYGVKRDNEYLPLKKAQACVKESDREKLDIALSNLINKKGEYDVVFTVTREDDKEERVIHSIAVLEERDNKPYSVSGVLNDITEQKNLERELKESIRNRNILLSNLPGMAYRCLNDNDWTMEFVSDGCVELTGYKPDQLINNSTISFNDLIQPEYRERVREGCEIAMKEKTISREEYQIKTITGELKWVWEQGQALYDNKGNVIAIEGFVTDITEQKKLESELKESIRRRNVLLSNLPGLAYRCLNDNDWTMEFVSEGCYELTGYEPHQLINNSKISYNDIIQPEFRKLIRESWEVAVKNKSISREEYKIKTSNGKIKWVWEQGQAVYDNNGNVIALEGFITDITNRKKREEEIKYLSYHDSLTGVYNRGFFDTELKRLNTKRQLPLSIIMGDINGLKMTNDIFGHASGDILLKTVSDIITSCCRTEDIIARVGGDEFSVILPKTDYKMAKKISDRITKTCTEYEKDKTNKIAPSISFGFATKNNEEQPIEKILRDAEELMYKKKLLEGQSLHGAVINSIRNTMAEKSNETKEHAQRLVNLSTKVGIKMNLDEKQLKDLELFATLHDIGKISVDSSILNKEEKLTEEDWFEIRRHPETGYRIAKSSTELYSIADYILSHHEHFDGKGYPKGLMGEEIPLISRILSVVDAYDAMTNDRPYRKALSEEKAIKELIDCKNKQFDGSIVEVFIDSL